MLRPGGVLAMFVPSGLSDDPVNRSEHTHTLYVVPEMMQEFFGYAGGFRNVAVEWFRPNCDYLVSAERV